MTEPDRTFTVKEVAKLVERSPATVQRWIREGYIKAVRLGREYRISRADLNAWWRSRGGGELVAESKADRGDRAGEGEG